MNTSYSNDFLTMYLLFSLPPSGAASWLGLITAVSCSSVPSLSRRYMWYRDPQAAAERDGGSGCGLTDELLSPMSLATVAELWRCAGVYLGWPFEYTRSESRRASNVVRARTALHPLYDV